MAVTRRRSHKTAEPATHRGVALNPQKLRLAMSARGLTARGLAKIAELSEVTISHAMHGRHLDPKTLERIRRALQDKPAISSVSELLDLQ
ncbi:MAG TPA: hypothetical protein VFR68_15100 [Candidatus Dormibacteraeota bacterium]|nr:hypothetical protein [Candidatus Dormibacteraeota bacterium]